MAHTVSDVIVPAAIAKREALAKNTLNPPYQSTKAPCTAAELNEQVKKMRMVLTLDGEYAQLHALTDYLDTHDNIGLVAIKLSASCSKTQQPEDVSPCFRTLKTILIIIFGDLPTIVPHYMTYITDFVIKIIPAASRRTFESFFNHAKNLFQQSFNAKDIRKGFKTTGIYPFCAQTILQQCTTWKSLTAAETKIALNAVTELAPRVNANGQLTSADLNSAQGGKLCTARNRVLEGIEHKDGKALELRPVNYRPALVLSHATIKAARSTLAQPAAEEQPKSKAKVRVN